MDIVLDKKIMQANPPPPKKKNHLDFVPIRLVTALKLHSVIAFIYRNLYEELNWVCDGNMQEMSTVNPLKYIQCNISNYNFFLNIELYGIFD